jgi:hypothetical protein
LEVQTNKNLDILSMFQEQRNFTVEEIVSIGAEITTVEEGIKHQVNIEIALQKQIDDQKEMVGQHHVHWKFITC